MTCIVAVQDIGDHVQQLSRVVQERGHGGGVDLLSAGQEDVDLVPGEGP